MVVGGGGRASRKRQGPCRGPGRGQEVIRSGREPLAGVEVEGGGGRGSEEGLSGSLEGYSLSVKAANLLLSSLPPSGSCV